MSSLNRDFWVSLAPRGSTWLTGFVVGCLALSAHAQTPASGNPRSSPQMWVSASVGSQHLRDASQYEQNNPGAGIEIPFKADWLAVNDARYALGVFRNSERALSVYAGAFLFPWAQAHDRFKWGAMVGVINGYERANKGGFFPLAVPTLAVEVKGLGANLFFVPPVAGIPATLALQVKMGF